MASEPKTLAALAVTGFRPESFGNYLASLGLLRILARRWPNVRAGWHEQAFHVVGGPTTIDEIVDALADVAAKRAWTPYERGWLDVQKKSTKAESGKPFALWQAGQEETNLEIIVAHVVAAGRLAFNPLLGKGGSAGNRDFSDGWKRAIDALAPSVLPKKSIAKTPRKKSTNEDAVKAEDEHHRTELKALVFGEPTSWMLEKLNAASWFSDANKLYNSGQRPFREGAISPWAMALACEGLAFFAGGASRRLGARARAVGAFPFVTRAAAPRVSGEAGRDLAEVWAPLWERPMTLREVVALFGRGRAEVRGRGALTPSAFATAIVRRGVDAGISEFRRFILGSTTSANTFEPRFEGTFRLTTFGEVATALSVNSSIATSTALERMLGLIERLPADRKVGERWRFVGLRGPLETAMLRVTANHEDPEAARALLDAAASALDRVDRNRSFRQRAVSWEPLPIAWLPALFTGESPGAEARLALALVSSFPRTQPCALYRFGVEVDRGARLVHPERTPARWVWRAGALPCVLSDVLRRRTLDWEEARNDQPPAQAVLPAASADVMRWLGGGVDDELLARWISRLALFDWRFVPSSVRSLANCEPGNFTVNGALCLFGLFQPLFDLRPVRLQQRPTAVDLLPHESRARTSATARRLASFLRSGQIAAAVRLAQSRYAMGGTTLAYTDVPYEVAEPERLLAAVLFPVFDHERTRLVQRWLRPRRQQGDNAHAR